MKKFYAVTAGDYSDYHIITITDDQKKAERIAAAYEADIEEYKEDAVDPLGVWTVKYNEHLKRWLAWCSGENWEWAKDQEPIYRRICGRDSNEWLCSVHAKDKDHALKIAQDKYAQWKAEQEGIA